jgi:hypothetical protein
LDVERLLAKVGIRETLVRSPDQSPETVSYSRTGAGFDAASASKLT